MPLVDLDDPEELRARWTALAAVAHATGFDRRWYADEDGYHHQDETGSVLRMMRLDDGRAVLFGFHTQHSRTVGADLLAGSPDWIGQPEVGERLAAGELGFVYGAFNGTWARASYPGDPWQPLDDGFAPIGQWITSDEDVAREMIEWVAQWSGYSGAVKEAFGVELIRTVGTSGITAEALSAFFDQFRIDPRSPVQPDVSAGVAAAEDFTRNFAAVAQLDDEPDTAEVSVVEDVVMGASSEPQVDEEEESFIVPPGFSPFTGQPIDEAVVPPAYVEPEPSAEPYEQTPYRSEPPAQDEYGVVSKKQGWFRRRKNEESYDAEPPADEPGGPAPGTFLPGGMADEGLPIYAPYGDGLPSSEPPRVGGGVHEGDDFYASLFADARAAPYEPDTDSAEQDFETAEQSAWAEGEVTSAYDPFADDTAGPVAEAVPEPEPEWVGGARINGEWVEHRDQEVPAPEPPAADQAFSPEDDDAPTAEIAAVADHELDEDPEEEPASFTGPSPFAPVPTRPAPHVGDLADRFDEAAAQTDEPGARFDGPTEQDGPFEDDLTAEIPAVADEQNAEAVEPVASVQPARGAAEGATSAVRFNVTYHDADEFDDEDEIYGAPTAKAQVEPHPQPRPWPEPQPRPEPWPQPEPHPAPWPQPGPGPEPTPGPGPEPVPVPGPQPEPHPEPTPPPGPGPEPQPHPEPWPEPEPTPQPEPEPGPWPEPEPEPEPARPEPEPMPWPDPEPSPNPAPMPRPEPTTPVEHAATFDPPTRPATPDEHAAWASQPDHLTTSVEHREQSEYPRAGFHDAEPTSFIPVVDAEEQSVAPDLGERLAPVSRLGDAAAAAAGVAAAARMSIPGLGLVGADGPRIAPAPGSLEEAMRAEVERPRPRPQESDAVKALRAWCRARTAIVPSGFTIHVQVLDPAYPSYRFDLEPPEVGDPEFAAEKLSGLLGDLWLAEAESEQGGWLFARIDTAGRTVRIDRWYDQVPDWWDNPVEARLDVQGLARRLHGRGREWQPSYLERMYTTAR